MNAAKFLDTNMLLCAYDLDAPAKRAVALDLVAKGWPPTGASPVKNRSLGFPHLGRRPSLWSF
jgi:hypothetical protein